MWKKDHVLCWDAIAGEITLSRLLSNVFNGEIWYFACVCCIGNIMERTLLGEELSKCQIKWGNRGVVGGDFNMVWRRFKRLSDHISDFCAKDFLSIIEQYDLVVLPLKGDR